MDFGSFGVGSKASMRRKQSNVCIAKPKDMELTTQSLLQALSKSTTSRVSAIPMPTAQTPSQSSHSHSDESFGGHYTPDDSYSNYSYNPSTITTARTASTSINTAKGGRSVSGTVAGSNASTYNGSQAREVKKLEDVIGLAKDRLLNWSYLMQWYGGDTHWLNTVKVRRELVEKELGPHKLDQRARQYFILGTSLAMLFDITVASDFLRALTRLMEEWEYYCEKGGKTMKGLFKGQKGKNKGDTLEAESYLVFLNLPFTPDFFAVHATTCSVIRDIYKKIMGMLLPNTQSPLPIGTAPPPKPMPDFPDSIPSQSLLHASTFIFSASTDIVTRANPHLSNSISQFSSQESIYNGGSTYSTPTAYHYSMETPNTKGGRETPFGESAAGYPPENGPVQHDAFEAFVNGDLPPSHCLIGDGQQLTPQIIETFVKVDAKLKKQFNLLVKEGDQFARKTLDDEIALLLSSLNGAPPLQFDYNAAMSGQGNGWQPSPSYSSRRPPPNSASTAQFSISTTEHHSIPKRHPGIVRQGSSGDSMNFHGQFRTGSNSNSSHGHGRGLGNEYDYDQSIDEEVVRDEDDVEGERRERDFGTV